MRFCFTLRAASRAEVQEMKSPGAELETAEVSNVPSPLPDLALAAHVRPQGFGDADAAVGL